MPEGFYEEVIKGYQIQTLLKSFEEFEAVFFAGGLTEHVYSVGKVRAYDTSILLEAGEQVIDDTLLPTLELHPNALDDIRSSCRALACGFWTASGFHVSRATELLLVSYWEKLRGRKAPPRWTWVKYCKDLQGDPDGKSQVLRTTKVGKQRLIKKIEEIGSEFRNPLIHPEHSLSEQDATLLFSSCVAAIEGMLTELT